MCREKNRAEQLRAQGEKGPEWESTKPRPRTKPCMPRSSDSVIIDQSHQNPGERRPATWSRLKSRRTDAPRPWPLRQAIHTRSMACRKQSRNKCRSAATNVRRKIRWPTAMCHQVSGSWMFNLSNGKLPPQNAPQKYRERVYPAQGRRQGHRALRPPGDMWVV